MTIKRTRIVYMGVFLGLETIIMITLLATVPNRTGVKKIYCFRVRGTDQLSCLFLADKRRTRCGLLLPICMVFDVLCVRELDIFSFINTYEELHLLSLSASSYFHDSRAAKIFFILILLIHVSICYADFMLILVF